MQLIFFIVYLIEAIIAYIYFFDNYTNKKKNYIVFLIAIGLYLIAFLINIIFNNTPFINEIIIITINILFGVFCFKTSIKACVFHSAFLTIIMFVTELIPQAGMSYILNIPIDAYRNDLSVLIIIAIISKTFYLFVCKIVSHFFSYKKHYIITNRTMTPLFLYPIIISLTLLIILYASTKYSFSKGLNLVSAVVSVLSLLFCCFIFIYNQRVQRQQEELMNLQAIKQRDEMNEVFYDLLEKKNEEQRVFTHDIKHHLFVIDSMDSISDVKQYIKTIHPELEKYQYIGNTNNKMFDLILNKYHLIAKSVCIDFKSDTRSSNLSFIEDSDLASLLGNLLDNAFEAAKASTKKQVCLITAIEKQFVLLSLVNSCSSAPVIDNDRLITTKTNKGFHGYGTKSVEKTAEKYNGICQWDFDEKNQEFHYNILFNK